MATIIITVPDDIVLEILKEYKITLTGAPKPADSSSLPGKKDGEAPPSDPKPAGEVGKGASGPQPSTPKPAENNQPPASVQETQGAPKQAQGAPICPTHGTKMRWSELPHSDGTNWFCPRKTGVNPKTGKPVYCKERM